MAQFTYYLVHFKERKGSSNCVFTAWFRELIMTRWWFGNQGRKRRKNCEDLALTCSAFTFLQQITCLDSWKRLEFLLCLSWEVDFQSLLAYLHVQWPLLPLRQPNAQFHRAASSELYWAWICVCVCVCVCIKTKKPANLLQFFSWSYIEYMKSNVSQYGVIYRKFMK